MALDTLIKKFFPAIIGLIVALIAHFQATGVVHLATGSALAIDADEMIAGSLRRQAHAGVDAHKRARSAQALIDYNVFDHSTDLHEKPLEEQEAEAAAAEAASKVAVLDLSDPLAAGQCEGVAVSIVTESPDPTWSLAILKAPGEERPSLRRVGDKAGDFEVAYIGFNRVEASPAVWLVKETKLCQALLFPKEPPPPAASTAPAVTAAVPTAEPKKGGAPGVPKEISDKIEKVSANEMNVDRSVVDYVLENQSELLKSARLVPEKGADGKAVGIRLFGIRPDTLLGTLGLQNGDRIETINGFNLSNPEEALNAYARLRTANKLSVKVTRRGQPTTVDLNIK
jgi:general secretion pathway protein C